MFSKQLRTSGLFLLVMLFTLVRLAFSGDRALI